MRKVLSLSPVKGEETEAQRGLSNLPGVTHLVSEGARIWALAVWLWNPWTPTLYRLKETGRGHAWQSTTRLLPTVSQSRADNYYLLGAAPIPSTDSATRHIFWRNLPALCGGYQHSHFTDAVTGTSNCAKCLWPARVPPSPWGNFTWLLDIQIQAFTVSQLLLWPPLPSLFPENALLFSQSQGPTINLFNPKNKFWASKL